MSDDRTASDGGGLRRDPALSEIVPAGVSEVEFVAWLEGRLSEAEAARIEAALVADVSAREAALGLSHSLAMAVPPTPDPQLERALARGRSLVRERSSTLGEERAFIAWLLDVTAPQWMVRTAMTASVAIIAVSGFMAGDTISHIRRLKQVPQTASVDMVTEVALFITTGRF